MARRLAAGIKVREDFPADALFEELIRQENLLTADHTLKYFRQEHHIPGPVIDRTQVQDPAADYPDLRRRAHAEAERHLGTYQPPQVLSADQLRDLEDVMKTAAGDFQIGF